MSIFDDLQGIATDLLSNFGKSATYKRVVNGAYDPATGTNSTTTTSVSLNVFAENYSDFQVAQSGGLILARDRKVTISGGALSFEPDPTTDLLTLDGRDYRVVRAFKPVGEDVIHELQVREA